MEIKIKGLLYSTEIGLFKHIKPTLDDSSTTMVLEVWHVSRPFTNRFDVDDPEELMIVSFRAIVGRWAIPVLRRCVAGFSIQEADTYLPIIPFEVLWGELDLDAAGKPTYNPIHGRLHARTVEKASDLHRWFGGNLPTKGQKVRVSFCWQKSQNPSRAMLPYPDFPNEQALVGLRFDVAKGSIRPIPDAEAKGVSLFSDAEDIDAAEPRIVLAVPNVDIRQIQENVNL